MKIYVTKPAEKRSVGWLARKHEGKKSETSQHELISHIFQSDKGK